MGIVLSGHRGSGDHGREEYLRGLCALLPEKPEVYSTCPEEDWRYGIGALAGLYRCTPGAANAGLQPGDWYLQLSLSEPGHLRRGVHSVFLCSGVGRLNRRRLRQLSRFEIVAVTEERSLGILRHSGLKNAKLAPEPTFLVRRQLRPLGGVFREDTVALCLTNPSEADTLLYNSYCHLISYLLKETGFHIALIPYCVKTGRNDQLLCRLLFQRYGDTGRVHLRQDADAPALRGDLSLCRCCVGAAGAVAAWGCGVPALCLSATSRTLGLSQKLFGSWQQGVLPWQLLKREDDLTRHFQQFLRHEDRHRCLLSQR